MAITNRSPHQLVRASAGSGKTHRLSAEFVALLDAGADPSTILATTFTRKAAAEILGRVLVRLAEAAISRPAAARLGSEIGRPQLGCARARRLLTVMCSHLHRVSITTLDAFFYRLLTLLRLESGVVTHPSLAPADDPEMALLRQDSLEAVLEEMAAVDFGDLVRLMERLQRSAARRGVSAHLDLLLLALEEVFAQAPEAELWSRLEVPAPPAPAAVATACKALEAAHADSAPGRMRDALAAVLRAVQERDWLALLSKGLGAKIAAGDPTYYRAPIPAPVAEPVGILVKNARARLLADVDQQTRATYQMLRSLVSRFEADRLERGRLLFSDLAARLRRQLVAVELQEIYYRLDGRVAHLMLDEFQDTSLDQWEVLRPFAQEIRAYGDGSRTFFCVGDPKQAIYGWRGGCADLFEQLEQELGLEAAAEESLDVSYRSSPVVLELVNEVFGNLRSCELLADHRLAVDAWAAAFAPHRAARETPGYVEISELADETDGELERRVAQHVADLRQRMPGRSVAVLAMTNRAVATHLDALREAGVESSSATARAILDDPAVAVVVSALRFADHPGDSASAFHFWHSPLADLYAVGSWEERRLSEVSRRLRRDWVGDGPLGLLGSWAQALAPYGDARSGHRLEQLLLLAERFESGDLTRPAEFCRFLETATVGEASQSGVRVMTVHKAKGLEFDSVVFADLERPMAQVQDSWIYMQRQSPLAPVEAVFREASKIIRDASPQLQAAFEQERARRCRDDLSALYVALTRARSGLFLFLRREAAGGAKRTVSYADLLRWATRGKGEGAGVLYRAGSLQEVARSGSTRVDEEQSRLALTPPAPQQVEDVAVDPAPRAAPPLRRPPTGRRELGKLLSLGFGERRRQAQLLFAWLAGDRDPPTTLPRCCASDELLALRDRAAAPGAPEAWRGRRFAAAVPAGPIGGVFHWLLPAVSDGGAVLVQALDGFGEAAEARHHAETLRDAMAAVLGLARSECRVFLVSLAEDRLLGTEAPRSPESRGG